MTGAAATRVRVTPRIDLSGNLAYGLAMQDSTQHQHILVTEVVARRLREFADGQGISTFDAAIAALIDEVERNDAGELESWLRDVVAPRHDAALLQPEDAVSIDAVRKRVLGGG